MFFRLILGLIFPSLLASARTSALFDKCFKSKILQEELPEWKNTNKIKIWFIIWTIVIWFYEIIYIVVSLAFFSDRPIEKQTGVFFAVSSIGLLPYFYIYCFFYACVKNYFKKKQGTSMD